MHLTKKLRFFRLIFLNCPRAKLYARSVDISAYFQFDRYSLVWYIDNTEDAATSRRKISRWIGLAEYYGSGLTYYVLSKSCRPILRSSVLQLMRDELQSPEVKALIAEYDQKVNDDQEIDPVEETGPDADDWTPEEYDQYLSAQVVLPQGDKNYRGTVKHRKR
jgi:hypothetical protein